eukprot:CAMPEP_0194270316 /NCGR_PEP_ID=MMETSP0169-20130528/4327_1 /TAXON_ID=218684 /ORGANISM="Corethron pennatum, Strain L29A3" /LENGTH=245 /DNA_ID=CAMNT_0039012323 /DNA_START=49 /DNA_END=786 /DNA_ORIENTATION=+
MLTAATLYQLCFGLLGAVSVRGGCWIAPDAGGVVHVPNGTDTIPEAAFAECAARPAVRRVVVSASVRYIGSFAFEGSGLAEVVFEGGSRLEVIGRGAFDSCYELKVITLPASLQEIGRAAFWETGLEQVIFEEGSALQKIGDYAFEDSVRLRSINLPPAARLGVHAFTNTGCPARLFAPGATVAECRSSLAPAEAAGGRGTAQGSMAMAEGLRGNEQDSSQRRTVGTTVRRTFLVGGLVLHLLWA